MSTPDTTTALVLNVTSSADEFGADMQPGNFYQYVATVATWIAQGETPTASAGAGSMYVPANFVVTLTGICGPDLSVVRDSVDGKASLTRLL